MTDDTAVRRGRRWRPGRHLHIRTVVIGLIAAAAIAAGGYGLAGVRDRATDAEAEALLTRANARQLAVEIVVACEERGEVAAELGDVCRQAERVAQDPAEPTLLEPTDEQLRPLVAQYVAEYLVANPPPPGRDGEAPSVETITALIRAELAANPPQDGSTPSTAEIRALVVEELPGAVAAFCAARDDCRGQDGVDGTDGADGQDGQDGADGQDGQDGADGEPPLSFEFTTTDPLGRETRHRCERDDPFDRESPTYTCRPVESEPGN